MVTRRPFRAERFVQRAFEKLNPNYLPGYSFVPTERQRTTLLRKKLIEKKGNHYRYTSRGIAHLIRTNGVSKKWSSLDPVQRELIARYLIHDVNPKGTMSRGRVLAQIDRVVKQLKVENYDLNISLSETPMESTIYEDGIRTYFQRTQLITIYEILAREIKAGEREWISENR